MEGHAHKKRKVESGAEVVSGEQDESIGFPFSRVKRLMESATHAKMSKDAVKAMSRATELFLQDLAEKVLNFTKNSRRKTLNFADLQGAIDVHDNLAFIKEGKILDVIAAEPPPPKHKSRASQETPQSAVHMDLEEPSNSQA